MPLSTTIAPPHVTTRPSAPGRTWGLSVAELHDAYWRARGVQVIRRGESVPLQRGADAYLLINPDQLVRFDLASLAERLLWHNARVTRLRLLDEHARPYRERVMTDADGNVQRIERRYRPSFYASYRVILTPSRRVARLWMQAPSRREAWMAVRRAVTWAEVDHVRAAGAAYDRRDDAEAAEFLARLVETWPTPSQSIAGLEEVERGVWRELGSDHLPGHVRVAPLWIGNRSGSGGGDCHIGPACIPDDGSGEPAAHTVFVRDIVDVTPGDPRPLARPGADERHARRRRTYHSTKRALDVVVSAMLILTCWPLLALIALAVWIDDGRPLFFGHIRQTRGGRLFRCWKFRTMRRDAEAQVEALRAQNQCDGPQVFIEDDPRVTRVGRLLRKTNLDELPQLWNVLVGHMSLVGPRPSPDGENQFCPAWRDVRLSVRPGIAGLWQLMRRREPGEDFQEWIKYDIEYVRRASLWFDLRILWRTARMLMFGRPGHAPEHTK